MDLRTGSLLSCRSAENMTDTSTLGTALAKEEHTTINIGDPDGTPRLVRYSGAESAV